MGFHFDGGAEIGHLNVRKEGREDEKEIALDIKFEAITSADILACFEPTLRHFMFNEAGAPRFPMLGALQVDGEMVHHVVKFYDLEFNDVRLSKFTLLPKEKDKVKMTFQASLKPSDRELAIIAEYLKEEIPMTIEPQPELPFDMPEVQHVF